MNGAAQRPPKGEPWCWETRELRASDAWRSAGINARRLIDFLLIVVPFLVVCAFAAVFILGFGIVTLGLGWLLYPVFFSLLIPLFVIWAMVYCGVGFASPASATLWPLEALQGLKPQ